MYVESRPKESGYSFMEIFPDEVFPMDSEQDRIKSKYHSMRDVNIITVCILPSCVVKDL